MLTGWESFHQRNNSFREHNTLFWCPQISKGFVPWLDGFWHFNKVSILFYSIFKARAAIFVLHIQYGPSGTPLSPMVQRQNCLLSTHVKLLGPAKQNHGYLTSLHRIRSDEISDKERRVRKFPTLEMTDFCEKEMKGTFSSPLHPRAIRALHLRQKLIINLRWR